MVFKIVKLQLFELDQFLAFALRSLSLLKHFSNCVVISIMVMNKCIQIDTELQDYSN